MVPPRLQTPRLILRDWRAEDLGPFTDMCADPQVMRGGRDGRTRSREESAAAMAAFSNGWDAQGYGLFALEHGPSGEFCGFCGLSQSDYPPALEISWRLRRGFWDQDFDGEAADRVVRFAFERLSVDRLLCISDPIDPRVRRVMDRLGMRLWLATTDLSRNRRLRVWDLERANWLHRQPGFHDANEDREYFFEEGCYILELLNDPSRPQMSIARARVPPGTTTRWHRLRGITEHYVILQGEGRAEVGSVPPHRVGPGDIVRIPPMVRQRITCVGDQELVFLAVCIPRFEPERYLQA